MSEAKNQYIGHAIRAATALLVVIVWAVLSSSINGENFDFAIHDAFLRTRGKLGTPDSVVVVALDEDTYRNLDLPMDRPLPREVYGRLLKRLADLGAKRVVFDILFLGRSSSQAWDTALREGVKALPTFLAVDHNMRENGGLVFHEIIKPDPYVSEFVAGVALVGMQLDGGVARHFFRSTDENVREFVTLSEAGAGLKKPEDRANVVLPREQDLINFYGPARTLKTVSLYQVLETEVPIPARVFKDKIVYVGFSLRTGLGANQKDSFQTPFGEIFGVEIHATQAANIIGQNWIRRLGPKVELISVGFILFILSFLVMTVRPQVAIAGTIAVIVVWFALGYLLLQFDTFMPGGTAIPGALPGVCLFNTLYWYLRTRKQQMQIEKAFANYLSPAMVAQLKKNPDLLKLGGEELVATALFTDIAGFTTITEQLGAVKVTAMLNAYFSDVTRVIMEEGGTVIKFIGDAVFALWNTPVRQPDHASRAIRAALRIQEVVDAFNKKGEFPPLHTRVGVNTGKMVVGNLGSERRFDFTAIGDSVNLASRVEGANKYLGSTILITNDALQFAESGFSVLKMGAIRVVGKEEPVDLHQLFQLPPSDELRARWDQALQLFVISDFDSAERLFAQVKAEAPQLETAVEFYEETISRLRVSGTEEGWRGEIDLEGK